MRTVAACTRVRPLKPSWRCRPPINSKKCRPGVRFGVLCFDVLSVLCSLPHACRWRKQLDELKRRWCAEQAASDRAWAAKLEEQHKKWLKVGHLTAPHSTPQTPAMCLQLAIDASDVRCRECMRCVRDVAIFTYFRVSLCSPARSAPIWRRRQQHRCLLQRPLQQQPPSRCVPSWRAALPPSLPACHS